MVILNDNGPRLTESQVADLESRIGLPLPDDYRRFLLENNGGSPTPDVISGNGVQGSETDLQVFFGINRTIDSDNIESTMHVMSDREETLSPYPGSTASLRPALSSPVADSGSAI